MGHTVRGAVSAWLALIVLQAVVTKGSGRVAGALSGLNSLAQRALDPNVPAIPDLRAGGTSSSGDTGGFFRGLTPAENQAVNDAQKINPGTPPAIKQAAADPHSLLHQLANLDLTGLANLGALVNH